MSEGQVKKLLGEPEGIHKKKFLKILKYNHYQIFFYRDEVTRIALYNNEHDIVEFEDQSGHFIRVFDPEEDR